MTNTMWRNSSPNCNVRRIKMHKLNVVWLLWSLFVLPGYVGPSYPSSYPSYPESKYPNPVFVPAMPGKIPKCVKDPRLTFCVEIEKYPKERIVYLIEQKMFDTDTLLQDETRDTYTFEARDAGVISVASTMPYGKVPSTGKGYPPSKPSYYHQPNNTNFGYHQPPKYSGGQNHYKPPPVSPISQYSTNNFYSASSTPSFNSFTSSYSNKYDSSFHPYNGRSTTFRDDGGPYPRYPKGRFQTTPAPYQPTGTQQSWWKKILRREKRQSDDNLSDLCPSQSNYIMPRAAQRVAGDWMFVVNVDERYTQLVKSETCIRNTCEGGCDVPDGFSAICQQQYVQKRLIALDGSGAKLNSDIFWFPSCCICKFRSNTG